MKSNNKFKGKVFMLPMLTVIEPIVPVQNYCPVTGKSIKNKRCLKSYSLEDHNLSELSFGQL